MATKKTIKQFKNYDFENCDVPQKYWGDYPHANYFKGEFLPVLHRELRLMAKRMDAELASFNGGYFYASAFFKKAEKCVYINLGDVRYNPNWYDRILYRSAKDEKDYTGGANHYCSYDRLQEYLSEEL